MNERIVSAADMMLQAANINIATSEANEICSVWRKVVSSVHSMKHDSEDSEKRMPLGERLAGNTRVIDLKNGPTGPFLRCLLPSSCRTRTCHRYWCRFCHRHSKGIGRMLPCGGHRPGRRPRASRPFPFWSRFYRPQWIWRQIP